MRHLSLKNAHWQFLAGLITVSGMSLVTLEVEIDHGRIISRGTEPLPEKATGLLTLLPLPASVPHGSVTAFIDQWAGAFPLSSPLGEDPRLDYLLKKHAK